MFEERIGFLLQCQHDDHLREPEKLEILDRLTFRNTQICEGFPDKSSFEKTTLSLSVICLILLGQGFVYCIPQSLKSTTSNSRVLKRSFVWRSSSSMDKIIRRSFVPARSSELQKRDPSIRSFSSTTLDSGTCERCI